MEWQLAATDLGIVRHWLADHGTIDGLVLEPRSTLEIVDTYLDTDDWRIHRAGFALRIRSESGKSEATLKSLHSAGAGVADRRELTESLEDSRSESIGKLTGPVGTRVLAVTGEHALRPLFEVRTTRQRHSIRKEDAAQPLGEIALDDTVIARPHGEPESHMQRVEVEVLGEDQEPLESLVNTLRGDCALEAASDSKYSQGLKAVGLVPAPAPAFAPTEVHRVHAHGRGGSSEPATIPVCLAFPRVRCSPGRRPGRTARSARGRSQIGWHPAPVQIVAAGIVFADPP